MKQFDMNRHLIWLGPLSVLAFVVVLAVMYSFVGTMGPVVETREPPELNLANQLQGATPLPQTPQGQAPPPGQLELRGQLVGTPTYPVGMGQGQNGQMQLINTPTYSVGVGQGQNGQMQLINTPTYSVGMGQGQNGQMQLINNPTFGVGIGQGPNSQIQLIQQVRPSIPYLGVDVGEVPDAVAISLKIPVGTGLYVKSVVQGSPAQKAGVKMGDVILKCAHQTLTAHEQIGRIVAAKKPGDVVKLVVNRNKRKKSFQVKLENAPQGLMQVAATTAKGPIWMGADIQDVDAIMKMQFKLKDTRGAIVSHVAKGSPAETAGLANGDVIRRFAGTRIKDVVQLQKLILKKQPGDQVQLTVLRNGQHKTIPIVMGQKSPAKKQIPFLGPADIAIEGSWIGMDVTELSPGDAQTLGLPNGTRGVLVNDVESPPASMVGFQTGDVITMVNGTPTPDMKHFVAATKKQQSAVVDMIRGNRHLFLSVPPPGFTQQGTQIHDPMANKFKKVAFNQVPAQRLNPQRLNPQRLNPRRVAILTNGPDMNAMVTGNTHTPPWVILVDRANSAYAVLDPQNRDSLVNIVETHGVSALLCSDVRNSTARELQAKGVVIYSGVVGSAADSLSLMEQGKMVAARGF